MAVDVKDHRIGYMRKIEAIIKPDMFRAVKAASAKADCPNLTAYNVKGAVIKVG